MGGRTATVQFAKNKNAPEQTPELIGIGKRNAAADADIFSGVLLEEIADHPDEATEHQPENHSASAQQFLPERGQAGIANGKRGHHAHFTEGEERNETEWIHSGQIGLAIGNVHRSPQDAGAERGPNAAQRMSSRALRGRSDGEKRGARAHHERAAKHADPAAPARLAKFVEEKKTPENAKQAVGIPEREGDAKPDIANGKDGQGVGNCPEAARENGPDHQMRRAADIRANRRGPE